MLENAHVLIDKSVEIEGFTIFGSPHTIYNGQIARAHHNKYAYSFGCIEETCIEGKLGQMNATHYDILVTHSPPLCIADISHRSHRGSRAVRDAVFKMNPSLHVFGHVHPYGGNMFKLEDCPENRDKISSAGYSGRWWDSLRTTFVNAASIKTPGVGEFKGGPTPSNILRQPVVIDMDRNTKEMLK